MRNVSCVMGAVIVGACFSACSSPACPSGTIEASHACIVQDELGTEGAQSSSDPALSANAGSSAAANGSSTQSPGGAANRGSSQSPGAAASGAADGNGSSDGAGARGGSSNGNGSSDGAGARGGSSNGPGGAPGNGGANGSMNGAKAMCGNGMREAGELCDGDCPAMCPAPSGCLSPMLVGSAATCDAQCKATEIKDCKSGDGCCAMGCKYPEDTDCSKSCGDGVVDSPEVCEPTSVDKPCPTSCDDGDPCTEDIKTGTPDKCNVVCAHMPITASKSGDSCCPPGANANNDQDCKAECGNEIKEDGELCDGDCPASCDDGERCTADSRMGTPDKCNVECKNEKITEPKSGDGCCPPGANANDDEDCKSKCGNQVKEEGEICDGDCPTECKDSDPCTDDVLVGTASQCNVVCKHNPMSRGPKPNCDTDNDPCTTGVAKESKDKCGYDCDVTHKDRGSQPRCSETDKDPCTTNTPVANANTCDWGCKLDTKSPGSQKACPQGSDPCTTNTPVLSEDFCGWTCKSDTKQRTKQSCDTHGDPCKTVETKESTTSCVTECTVVDKHTGETDVNKCPDSTSACMKKVIVKNGCQSECSFEKTAGDCTPCDPSDQYSCKQPDGSTCTEILCQSNGTCAALSARAINSKCLITPTMGGVCYGVDCVKCNADNISQCGAPDVGKKFVCMDHGCEQMPM